MKTEHKDTKWYNEQADKLKAFAGEIRTLSPETFEMNWLEKKTQNARQIILMQNKIIENQMWLKGLVDGLYFFYSKKQELRTREYYWNKFYNL